MRLLAQNGQRSAALAQYEACRRALREELDVEPEGEPSLWAEPERLGTWFEKQLHRGSRELRERLEQIERRLEELERKLDDAERTIGRLALENDLLGKASRRLT